MTLPQNQRSSAVGTDSQKAPVLAGANLRPEVIIVLAQAASGTTAPLDIPFRVFEGDAYGADYGYGSPFSLALDSLFKANDSLEVWGLPVGQPGTGSPAAASIGVSIGTVTKSFTAFVRTKGLEISFAGIKGDSQDQVALNIKAALDAQIRTPFTADIDTGVTDDTVDLTTVFNGVQADEITLSVVDSDGRAVTAADYGIDITVTGFTGGAGNVDISTAVGNIAETIKVTRIVCQVNDSTSLDLIEGLGNDRRDPQVGERVLAYSGYFVDTSSNTTISAAVTSLKALADARINDKVNCLIPAGTAGLSVELVAELIARVAGRYQTAPGKPPRGLKMLNPVNEPKTAFWFSNFQRNEMYIGGIANFEYIDGVYRIMDLCNMYHPTGDTKLNPNQPIDKDDEDITAIANMLYDLCVIFSNPPWEAVKFIGEKDISSSVDARKISDVETAVDNRINVYVDNIFIKDAEFAKNNKDVRFNATNPERVDVTIKAKLATTGRIYDFVLSLFKAE